MVNITLLQSLIHPRWCGISSINSSMYGMYMDIPPILKHKTIDHPTHHSLSGRGMPVAQWCSAGSAHPGSPGNFFAGKPTSLTEYLFQRNKLSKIERNSGFSHVGLLPMLVSGDVQFFFKKKLMIVVMMVVRIVMCSASSFISFHFISFHFISFHFISFHFIHSFIHPSIHPSIHSLLWWWPLYPHLSSPCPISTTLQLPSCDLANLRVASSTSPGMLICWSLSTIQWHEERWRTLLIAHIGYCIMYKINIHMYWL